MATLAVFVVLGSVTVAAPFFVFLVSGDRAEAKLDSARQWLIANNHTVIAIVLLLLGAKLLGDGLGIIS